MKVTLTMQGGKETARGLRALPAAMAGQVQLKALRAGALPIRASMEALAPRGDVPPHIADNIVIGVPTQGLEELTHEHEVVVAVGPQKDFFYGFFWEYGTASPPGITASPFARPAFDTQAGNALAAIGQEFGRAIQAAAEKVAREQGLKGTRGSSGGGVGL